MAERSKYETGEFKYSTGVWNRRFWKGKAPNLIEHSEEKVFNGKVVGDIILALIKTMDYELDNAAPLKELMGLEKGTKYLHDKLYQHLYTSPIRKSDEWEKLIKVADRLHEITHKLSLARRALIEHDKFIDTHMTKDKERQKQCKKSG